MPLKLSFFKSFLNKFSLFLSLLLVLASVKPSFVEAQSTPARLSFTPTSQTVSGTGRTGTINAFLNPGGAGVASVELVITFNPSIVTVNNITPGSFFTSSAGTPIEIIKSIDNSAGKIHYAVGFPLGSGHSSTAQNTAAVISFTSRGIGTSTFNFVTTGTLASRVSNINAVNILGGVTSGSVVVGGTGGTATPTRSATNTPTRSTTTTPTRSVSNTPAPNPSGNPVLSFAPTSQTVSGTGRTGTFNAFLTPNGRGVASAELVINFNPSIIRVDNISPGAFFNSASGSPIEIIKSIDNNAGRIHYAIGFPLGSSRTSTTANTAAVISFTSLSTGTSSLSYVNSGSPSTKVSDLNAQNILGSVSSGSVVVSGSSPQPTGGIGSQATLSINPSSQNLSVGGNGNVAVNVNPNANNVASAEIVITYDKNIVSVNNITPGSFFTGSGTPVEIIKNIDNNAGRIHYAIGFPLGSGRSSTSSGTIANISFSGVSSGSSTFNFVTSGNLSTKLSNLNAGNILLSTNPGTVTVGNANPGPSTTPTGTRISFTPTSQTMSGIGRNGIVNVLLEPAGKNIASAEFIINFNPQVIRVNSIAPGAFFTAGSAGAPVEVIKNIDNNAGRIHYAIGFPLGSGHSSTMSNVAAVIGFTSIGNGTSTLTFDSGSQVSDINATNVLATRNGGSIVVSGGTPNPVSPTPQAGGGCYITDPEPTKAPKPTEEPDDDKDDEDHDDNDRDDEKPTVTLTATPSTVSRGGSTIIRWSSQNAVFCNGFDGTNGWAGSKGTSGSFTVSNMQSSTTFGIICGSENEDRTDSNHNDDDGDETVKRVTVQVSGSLSDIDINENITTEVLGITAANEWTNVPLSNLTGSFSISFSATPREINDSYVGVSNGPAQYFTDLTSIIHFTHNSTIVARDDIQYAATQIIRYNAGQTYNFRLDINTNTKTYSAYVTSGGQTQQFASNYSFRLEQQNTNSVNYLAMFSRTASSGLKVCSIKPSQNNSSTISPTQGPKPTPGDVDVEIPTPSACTPSNNGDANGDGRVDGVDYSIWDQHYNKATTDGPSSGDFDCSGNVDGVDYVIWLMGLLGQNLR